MVALTNLNAYSAEDKTFQTWGRYHSEPGDSILNVTDSYFFQYFLDVYEDKTIKSLNEL